ncbi:MULTISPECIES: SDR family NAD(P)-dependent oxidoreductase [unclassified Paenibacillus]|uniref:SDR family NAD(P)-dependent oxidoreductase n=1 Tax=unclassified Paenibacillus TaxID=185978 RepID=UPI0010495957|nr:MULTISPECIES: SDR family NAD(P)-dependent oxidoreductase [unclassified Paenibacillus]NIK68354.1 NAD(P)-dependent dehydrogenase (short-subunit alcohol dehydrogenase family) [Paenibacillus sp. BK720]TCM99359.1 NAD(P)-dependent dehydrogenase (short-subunit alcohol dehydrogenase family) [Paenibacillus sp. BK033]
MTIQNDFGLQTPIASGFGPRTTAQTIIGEQDLRGKMAIVTGGYSGLGLEAVKALASAGARVIVPARALEKAQTALEGVSGVELERLDLMDPASIDAFATRFLASGRPLHILLNAGGIMAAPLVRDSRGFESQLATNHLGHFQLALRLWPALEKAKGARIVSVSSRALQLSAFDFVDPNFNSGEYDKWLAYARSKTANALFAVAMDKRGKPHGVRAFSVHPGTIATDLARHLTDDELRAMGALNEQGERVFTEYNDEIKTIEEGAATLIWCAVHPQLDGKGGVYCENGDIAGMTDTPYTPGVFEWAVDPKEAERLWKLSEQLIGIKFEN